MAAAASMAGCPQTITGQEDVTVAGCTYTQPVYVTGSAGIAFIDDTFVQNASLSFKYVINSRVDGSTFSADGIHVGGVLVEDILGVRNTFADNTIDGGSPTTSSAGGFDDGLIINDSTADTVSGNRIANVWDCGIEGLEHVTNTTFADNTISAAPIGICSYWWTSWRGNTVARNMIRDVRSGFYFDNLNGAPDAESTVYFADNTFTDNTVGPYVDSMMSASFNMLVSPPYKDSRTNGARSDIETVSVDGNVFAGNDFGTTVDAPSFGVGVKQPDGSWVELDTATSFVNGGGNVCGPPPSAYEPICGPKPPPTTTTTTTSTTTTSSSTTTTIPVSRCHGQRCRSMPTIF